MLKIQMRREVDESGWIAIISFSCEVSRVILAARWSPFA
jgi:hypothetical protein